MAIDTIIRRRYTLGHADLIRERYAHLKNFTSKVEGSKTVVTFIPEDNTELRNIAEVWYSPAVNVNDFTNFNVLFVNASRTGLVFTWALADGHPVGIMDIDVYYYYE